MLPMDLEGKPMRAKLVGVVSCLILLLPVPAVFGQRRGGDIFVTPVANAPFMAVVQVQRTIVQPDGKTQDLKTIRAIARDSQGRIYNESRQPVPVTENTTPAILVIHLYDPQTRTNIFLYPQQGTFRQNTLAHPPSTLPPDLYATPAGNSFPQSQFVKEEDLGTRTLEGTPVHGVRELQTVPAGAKGGTDIVVTDEYWYSEELRLNLQVKHDDPRTGIVTFTVTQVSRTEPGPSVFQIPPGYRAMGQPPGRNQ
jgi:hypothetical protein